uniref:Uncharacterized protein n=1 Tax=Magallana gigas TaxID=29159 RepID=K1PPM6_MAGGI
MKVFLFFLSAVCGSQAFIVCPPDACATVRCAAVTAENCDGVVKQNGGFCGCCDSCVSYLAEGESCLATLFLGMPSTADCGPGLHCNMHTHKCVATLNPCAQELSTFTATQNGLPLLGAHKPLCDVDGYYQPKQCAGSHIKRFRVAIRPNLGSKPQLNPGFTLGLLERTQSKPRVDPVRSIHQKADPNCVFGIYKGCYCVSKEGHQIEGYTANVWEAQHMTCQCARDQYEYMQTGLIGRLFYCTANGSYQNYQCMGDVCRCTDADGNVVANSHSVSIGQIDTLKC